MSGSLIGGVVGAAIGFFVGGPAGASWGWMIGSAAGGILLPPSPGPNLTDLTPQSSEYGRPIPIIYSVMALGGNIIWASDLVKTGDAGGKGSSDASSSQGTYAANFAVLICESAGDKTLGRIWSGPDKRLVYDPATGKLESGTLTFYNGAEDQMPDPLMESYLGAGNVPAYRGYAIVVLEGFNVTDHDGNRIPILTIEIGAQGTPVPNSGPENLGTVFFSNVWASTAGGGSYVAVYSGSSNGIIQVRQSDLTTIHNFQDETGFSYRFWDDARNTAVNMLVDAGSGSTRIYYLVNMTTGAITDEVPWAIAAGDLTFGCGFGATHYVFAVKRSSANGYGTSLEFVDPATNAHTKTLLIDAGDTDPMAEGGFFCADAASNLAWIVKASGKVCAVDLSATGSVSSTFLGTLPTTVTSAINFNTNEYKIAFDNTSSLLWCARLKDTVSGLLYYSTFSDSAQVSSGSITSQFEALSRQAWAFVPPDGVWLCGVHLITDHFMRFDLTTGVPAPVNVDGITDVEVAGSYNSSNGLDAVMYDPLTNYLVGIRSSAVWSHTPTADLAPPHLVLKNGVLSGSSTGGGGTLAYNYQTLAQVVTDLSIRAGLTADDIDVTQLTDQVDGYAIANQVAVMDAIRTLMPVYYFDYVESQGIGKFVKRGGAIAVEIDDDDLGAQPSDSTQVMDLLQTNRGNDDDLPGTLSVDYVLAATNYGPATKYARRLIGHSQSEQTLQLPMVLSDLKALQAANVNLHDAWVGRLTYGFQLPRKFSYLEPTDVVGIEGFTMRITKVTQSADGYFKCEAVRDDATTYTQSVIVTETPPSPQTVNVPSPSLLELM